MTSENESIDFQESGFEAPVEYAVYGASLMAQQ